MHRKIINGIIQRALPDPKAFFSHCEESWRCLIWDSGCKAEVGLTAEWARTFARRRSPSQMQSIVRRSSLYNKTFLCVWVSDNRYNFDFTSSFTLFFYPLDLQKFRESCNKEYKVFLETELPPGNFVFFIVTFLELQRSNSTNAGQSAFWVACK